jgi:hypothetical protein
MARKLILSGFMSALLLASVIAYSLPAFAQGPDSPGKSQVVYAFGEIPGKNIIVHVAVIVPPGLDKNEVINQALNYQGAKKIEKSDYSLINTLKWDPSKSGTPNVTIFYDGDNEPLYLGGVGSNILNDVMTTWTNVPNSNFVFTHGGDSTKECPSLVKECKGVADGENTFGWEEIKQPRTLGVTYWKTTEDGLEVDVVLTTNKKTSWNTNNANYDVFTVVLHELGHALGLAHSTVSAAVMYASYHGYMDNLHQDDICGIQALFGAQDDACFSTTGTGEVTDIDVTFSESVGTGTATSEDGSVSFVKRGNPSGCYTIDVELVNDSQYTGETTYTQASPYCP